jgi:ADP-ribose pyrophosphatase YjhB (NUDIX family)
MTSQPVEQHYRFCPRCGIENPDCGVIPFRCAECQYAQFFGPVAAVGALVINDADQLLLVRRARDPGKGKWGLPGGFVDRDETMEQAVARETMEETQLRILDQQYLMTFPNHYDYRGIVIPVIDLFFVCRVASPEKIVLDDAELTDFQWVRPSAAYLDNMAFDSNRLAIEKWLETSE